MNTLYYCVGFFLALIVKRVKLNSVPVDHRLVKEGEVANIRSDVDCPTDSNCSWRYRRPILDPNSQLITSEQELSLNGSSANGVYYYWDETRQEELYRIFKSSEANDICSYCILLEFCNQEGRLVIHRKTVVDHDFIRPNSCKLYRRGGRICRDISFDDTDCQDENFSPGSEYHMECELNTEKSTTITIYTPILTVGSMTTSCFSISSYIMVTPTGTQQSYQNTSTPFSYLDSVMRETLGITHTSSMSPTSDLSTSSYDLVHEATTSSMPVSVIPSPTPTDPEIIMYGPSQAVIGTNISINCSIAVEGDLNPDIHITTPLGETINASEIVFTAMPNNTGNYSCNAFISKTMLKARHHLLVINVLTSPNVSSDVIFNDKKSSPEGITGPKTASNTTILPTTTGVSGSKDNTTQRLVIGTIVGLICVMIVLGLILWMIIKVYCRLKAISRRKEFVDTFSTVTEQESVEQPGHISENSVTLDELSQTTGDCVMDTRGIIDNSTSTRNHENFRLQLPTQPGQSNLSEIELLNIVEGNDD
ncbi:uncharacterized protein [Dysidea avara]|uniref:uncharacterized protein isoform X2 n=1 Tax=Dysidea avara TaxID=196820 RepID=UPI00331D60F9